MICYNLWYNFTFKNFVYLNLHVCCMFFFPDINELNLPKTCQVDFPDPDDLLNFKLVIAPDEVFNFYSKP